MLRPYFDLQLATFNSPEEIIPEEVSAADLVVIRGYLPGGIYHSEKLIWRMNLQGIENIKQLIRSKRERKQLDLAYQTFTSQGFSIAVHQLTHEKYQQFVQLYQETTLNRPRAISFEMKEQVEGKLAVGIPVFIVEIISSAQLEAGLLFSVQDKGQYKEAKVSFSAKRKHQEVRGGAGGVLLAELLQYCLKEGISSLTGGRGTNPAGLTAKAGLFEFKSRYGYSAYPDGAWQTLFLMNRKPALSELVFVTAIKNRVGYLLVSDDRSEKNAHRFLTKEVSLMHTRSFRSVITQSRKSIRALLQANL